MDIARHLIGSSPERVKSTHVRVRYQDLLESEDSNEALVETVEAEDVRLRPPPPPAGFLSLVRAGDSLELFYEDGWWEVLVLGVSRKQQEAVQGEHLRNEDLNVKVISKMYDKTHDVDAQVLRPGD